MNLDFNSLDYSVEEQLDIATDLLCLFLPKDLNSWTAANSLVRRIRSQYCDIPFHNFAHALDVAQFIAVILANCNEEWKLSAQDRFLLVFLALCIDLGHLGVDYETLYVVNDFRIFEEKVEEVLELGGNDQLRGFQCWRVLWVLDHDPFFKQRKIGKISRATREKLKATFLSLALNALPSENYIQSVLLRIASFAPFFRKRKLVRKWCGRRWRETFAAQQVSQSLSAFKGNDLTRTGLRRFLTLFWPSDECIDLDLIEDRIEQASKESIGRKFDLTQIEAIKDEMYQRSRDEVKKLVKICPATHQFLDSNLMKL